MTYEQFIEELESLFLKGKALVNTTNSHENSEFRAWRHEVTDLLVTIRNEGYKINSSIESRQFYQSGYSVYESEETHIGIYKQALEDTINEISTILDKYKKYGTPTSEGAKSIHDLEYPQKITWGWLKTHIPVGWWFKGSAIMLSVFLAGVAVGQSTIYKQLLIFGQNVEVIGAVQATLPNNGN